MSTVSSTSPSTIQTNGSSSAVQLPTQSLNQQDFLNLLVTQMTSQDPLNPMSDTDFVAQMASFSSLQANQIMEADMGALQANSLIGETVNVSSANNTPSTGVVTSVQISAGTPQVIVNGQTYNLTQITGISPTPTGTNNSATTNPTAATNPTASKPSTQSTP